MKTLPLWVGQVILAVLFNASLPVTRADTDPLVTLSNITPQSVTVTWFADDGVSYQLEAGTDLTAWANSGPWITGTGNFVNVVHPVAGLSRVFFRLKLAGTVTAVFNPATGTLTIVGGAVADFIALSRNAAGVLLVNGGNVPITGGVATVANTTLVEIFGGGGNDELSLNEANGALPQADLFGEVGDDSLTGGAGNDELNGGPGADILLGRGGADILRGGGDNDTLTGGDADDQVFGDGGNDRMVWNPGDDTDLNEGGDAIDTVEVNGGGGAEQFTATANGARVRFDRISPAPFSIDIGTSENLVLNANGGDDSFSATGNLATLIGITVDGGAGNDTLLGSNGIDTLLGGDNDDFIDGQQGADVAFLGAGDDSFQWDPGDGSDTVEGQAGNDTLLFNGSNIAEIFETSANGGRVRFTRNVGNIVMDLDDIENLEANALGGADIFIVNDLAGTDLGSITADLAGTLGGMAGDGEVDIVTINGTAAADAIYLSVDTGAVEVAGLAVAVRIERSEAVFDDLVVNGLGGVDFLDIGLGVAALIEVIFNQ